MGKIKYDILEDHFSQQSSLNYELSILFGMDSFAYMISDLSKNVLALKEYVLGNGDLTQQQFDLELHSIVTHDPHIGLSYQNTRIAWINPRATLIPNRLYNPSEKEAYFQLLSPLNNKFDIQVDSLDEYEIKNVYAVDRKWIDFINKNFPKSKQSHVTSGLLKAYKDKLPAREETVLYLHIRNHDLHLALFEEGKPLFFNNFKYKTTKDCLYYILLVFDQFDKSPEDIPMYISGKLVQDSEIYRLLHRYVQRVSFVSPPEGYHFGTRFSLYPKYFFFDLLSLIYFD